MGLYLGGLIAAAWAISLAAGPEAYGTFKALLGSPLGKLVMFGMSAVGLLPPGQRRPAPGLGPRATAWTSRSANASAYMVFGFTIAATLAVWGDRLPDRGRSDGLPHPLSTARGLGSAKHGVGHWHLRARLRRGAGPAGDLGRLHRDLCWPQLDYYGAVDWIGSPVNATLMVLTIAISFMHMQSGLRVVIEDYVYSHLSKAACLLANLFVCGLGGRAGHLVHPQGRAGAP